MPIAINGSGTVTGISVGGLPDGIVDTDMLAANAVSAAKASGSAKGIRMADQWRMTSQATVSSNTDITANLERNDTSSTLVGSGMTHSSGIFSFPETGLYWISAGTRGFGNGGARSYAGINIKRTTDNGTNWYSAGDGYDSISTDGYYFNAVAQSFFDVTDTSTHKLKFVLDPPSASVKFDGNSDYNSTYFTFLRLGDT